MKLTLVTTLLLAALFNLYGGFMSLVSGDGFSEAFFVLMAMLLGAESIDRACQSPRPAKKPRRRV
jgi:hypothetical protein